MKKNRILVILAVLCIISLLVMVQALLTGGSNVPFTPPPFEAAALAGVPEVPDHCGYQELDADVFRVGLCGVIQPRQGQAEIWFTNPKGNAFWLKLRVLDEKGQILGQTGLLRPGEYVRQVEIISWDPGMPVVLKVMAYEPNTYHSAGALELHTHIAVE